MYHHLKALRYDSCVTRGSHSFTRHPHTNHTCLYSPAARHHRPLAGTSLYCLVNRGTQVWETCPEFLRRVTGRESNPRPLDRKSVTFTDSSVLMSVIWFVLLLHNNLLVWMSVSVYKRFGDNQISWHSNDVTMTVKYPVALSSAVQHFGRIRNRDWIVKNGWISASQQISSTFLMHVFVFIWY